MKLVNLSDSNIAIKGHDPVSYTTGTPTQGEPSLTVAHDGGIYHFASEDNKTQFEANPALYLPQYGGFCAMGVCQGKRIDIDPTAFVVVDNKLFVFATTDDKTTWEADKTNHTKTADGQWTKGELIAG